MEIENLQGKYLFVATIDRPPNQHLLEFMEFFQPLIERVTRDNKLSYIMCDFLSSLVLLNSDLHSITNDFVNVLFLMRFFH